MSALPSDSVAVLQSIADSHDYFSRNADLRMTTGDHGRQARRLREVIAALEATPGWQPIETAPKGGGAESVTDPVWVEPPRVLLLFSEGEVSAGYWDYYYDAGGRGHQGCVAWVEPISGELLALHYGPPTHWMTTPRREQGEGS